MFLNLLLDASADTNTGCNNSQIMTPILIVVGVLFVIALFVLPMITNKKQKKNVEEQRSNLSIGDTIETVGGIIGVIKEIREPAPGRRELVIETGVPGNTTTIIVDVQALYVVLNRVGGAPAVPTTHASSNQSEIIKLNETPAAADKSESSETDTPFPETDEPADVVPDEAEKASRTEATKDSARSKKSRKK